MQHAHREFGVFFFNRTGNSNLRGADQYDIDALGGQGGKHLRCHTGMIFHSDTDHRNFGDVLVSKYIFCADLGGDLLFCLQSGFKF